MPEESGEKHWRLDILLLTLPSTYEQTGFERKREQVLNLFEYYTETTFASWTSSTGSRLSVHCWKPNPPRAGHPIRMVERWEGTIAGREGRFARTDIFEGKAQEVLVAWFEAPGDRQYRIVGWEMDRAKFLRLVEQLRLRSGGDPASAPHNN